MSDAQKRRIIRDGLREAAAHDKEPYGPGEAYANRDNVVKAILNLYWQAVQHMPD